ncbi:hypothetical protein Cgig2_012075 [Carnegiea gigantea]|uniref:Uncharacterized protein n=1 Tax=Carnegiea gigantea TaxID=171969 RepID=A0A9Q1GUE1_9CARY|nr:hypothetical protein Cgig2_012075 [Carnegiea gigantea]
MDNIIAWNVRGLNNPNKLEDIKVFLNKHEVGLVALLETKRLGRKQLDRMQEELHANPMDETIIAQEKERRIKYLEILKSSLSLIKQQTKQQWLNYGDQCSRIFFAKIKQSKLRSYMYAIKDERGNRREGFAEVAKVMAHYYQGLLGRNNIQRKEIDWNVIRTGP